LWCEHCQRVVSSQRIQVRNASDISIGGGSEPCPDCGNVAMVMSATLDVRDEVITVLSASDWTKARLFELHQALRDAQQLAQTDVGAAVARVAQVDQPTAGLLLRIAAGWTKEDTWKLIGALIAIMAIVVPAWQKGSGVSDEDVRRIVNQEMDRRQDDEPALPALPPSPGSPPPAAPAPPESNP